MNRKIVTIDANEACAYVAYRLNEVIAIYPITPSTSIGELSDAWSAAGVPNIWGSVPLVQEMQAEGGAAGAVHGALQAGALTTTFTASQGLLLMIPNMFKIAGELTSTVFHVTARSIATNALSIFGDHSDVMAVRQTGFALLGSRSGQEAHDMSLISQCATLEARVPFLHFFDGWRTSSEVSKIEYLNEEDMRALIDDDLVNKHRQRALSPDHPFVRGTAMNTDVFFQAHEASNPFYDICPQIVQTTMDKFEKMTGRSYHLFDYFGAPDAERVIISMCSGAETIEETAKYMILRGEKVGALTVRLYRPFSVEHFLKSLPATVKTIAVLDRTKEPGAVGEPLYQDVVTAISEGISDGKASFKSMPRIIGGRYGLSSKGFTPAMVKGVFDEMSKPKLLNHFTVGINDDVSHTNVKYEPGLSFEDDSTVRCVFFGLGSDGTVGANKNSIKIIGEETKNFAQGYFDYDSKKSGSLTVSHLRFGPKPIHAAYHIGENDANFVACHQFTFLDQFDMLKYAKPGGIFLLNSLYGPDEVLEHLPCEVQQSIVDKKLRFFIIDGNEVAKATGMGGRINTIMQTCFFAISGILPRDEAIDEIKKSIKKTYGKRGDVVVKQNFEAVDQTLAHLHEVKVSGKVNSNISRRPAVPKNAPEFVRNVLGPIIAKNGDNLPVSALPADGTFPSGTSQWEKRNLALEIPVWQPELCIQCGKCSFVCPHAVIRQKIYQPELLKKAPPTFKSVDYKSKELPGLKFTVQISPEDCTGCGVCVEACPSKDKSQTGRKAINMADQPPLRVTESANWEFFLTIPDPDRTKISPSTVKNSQLLRPLFEFSGACGGCGETPYLRLLTQLYGDHMVVANATGCSSIYGANLPTTPWSFNADGRGPAWANSLFEDNAEFGMGMRISLDKQSEYVRELLKSLSGQIGEQLVTNLLEANQDSDVEINAQRSRVEQLKKRINEIFGSPAKDIRARTLFTLADNLTRRSVWIIGGDGWAYDIGYGGLDHVLASGRNVNVLVLDTGVYSNTGGQASKATPRAAVAKFAANGKDLPQKDLGLIAMTYGYIYVARVAMGFNDQQTLRAFLEAEAYDGPSLIVAYCHCINQGIDMRKGLEQQKLAVQSGVWPLFRYNPALLAEGKNPLTLDSKEPNIPVQEYAYNETRYRMLTLNNEARAELLMKHANEDAKQRWEKYRQLAEVSKDSDQQ